MTITPASVRATTFAASSRLRRGYDADQVDAFVERIAQRLESGEGLTSNDVYRAPLGRAGIGGRGYAEADVDRFLEAVHVALLRLEDAWGHENAVAAGGTPDGGGVDEGSVDAEGAGAGASADPAVVGTASDSTAGDGTASDGASAPPADSNASAPVGDEGTGSGVRQAAEPDKDR